MSLEKSKYIQWFCGFYEGEGYISNDKSNNNRLRLGIAQNDKTPLDLALKICVGYEWRICHNDALEFIKDIKPFMLIPYKITQINNCVELAKKGIERRFKCHYCEIDYASPSGRRRHEKSIHLNSNASPENSGQDNQIAGNP